MAIKAELLSASDEALVERYRSARDSSAFDELLGRHRNAFAAEARRWFIRGADSSDVQQEVLIGFIKAVRDFDPTNGQPFISFAKGCIRRHVITAVRAANRDKHRPVIESDRFEMPVGDADGGATLGDTLAGRPGADPAHQTAVKDELNIVADALGVRLPSTPGGLHTLMAEGNADLVPGLARQLIDAEAGVPGFKLSLNELEVFLYRLFDTSYAEIADRMGRDTKYVDNCFQRVRRKATKALQTAVHD